MPVKKLLVRSGLFLGVTAGILGVMASAMPAKNPVFHLDKTVQVDDQTLKLEFAQTEAQVTQGLSDRLNMTDDEGMLFLLGESKVYPFWMNRMHFPLDIIWIKDGQVVEIAYDLPPPAQTAGIPVTHTPDVEANEVLELNAGGAKKYDLHVGSNVDF